MKQRLDMEKIAKAEVQIVNGRPLVSGAGETFGRGSGRGQETRTQECTGSCRSG